MNKTLKKFNVYMDNRKVLLPLSLVMSALNGIVSLLPYIFVWLIVRTLLEAGGIARNTPVNSYAWAAVAAAITSLLIYFVSLLLSHLAAFRVETNLRRSAMRKIVAMPLGFFDSNTSGRMRKIIDEDASSTHTFLAHILPDLAASIVSPLAVMVLIFIFNRPLGVACLIPLVSAFVLMGYMMDPKRNDFRKLYMDAQERMSTEAVEYVRGIPVVKVFQQTVFSFKRFYDSIITYKNLVTKYTLTWQRPMSLYTTLIHGFAYFLVPAAILLVGRTGSYAPIIADMFLYVLITPVIATNIMKIMYLNQNLYLADEAITRIERLTDADLLPVAGNPKTISGYGIDFENVVFAYPGTRQNAVDNVSFSVPQGKMYALVGPSGGGKTTIARLIPRFWDVTGGSVKIGGVDVRHIAQEELMRNISFVFQNTKLFKTTLLENIRYGNPHASDQDVQRAIGLSRSREIIDCLPQGLDTKIGAEGTYLSGGEQQRIVLARAFLKDAPILILDEATAFADPENEHLIQQALHELMKGKTVLMIAHRLTSIQQADSILVIEDGKITEQGTHDELLTRNGTYNAMWNEYQKSVEWTV